MPLYKSTNSWFYIWLEKLTKLVTWHLEWIALPSIDIVLVFFYLIFQDNVPSAEYPQKIIQLLDLGNNSEAI
mgnify:CR=1 FL=1